PRPRRRRRQPGGDADVAAPAAESEQAAPRPRQRLPGDQPRLRPDAVLRAAAHRRGAMGRRGLRPGAAAQPDGDARRGASRHPEEAARGNTMSHDAAPLPDANLPPFAGGRRLMLGAAIAGAAGLLATLLGGLASPRPALLAYLIAFVYWLGLAIGAASLVMANHATGAHWSVTVRRLGENIAAVVPIFVLLFVPLFLRARHIWFWVAPPEAIRQETLELLAHKRVYLNLISFFWRAVAYFAIWCGIAWRLRALSLQQDETGDPALTISARRLSAPGLALFILSLTFASFDWLMSLQPTWYSTIFGLYVYAGAFVASLALICLITTG